MDLELVVLDRFGEVGRRDRTCCFFSSMAIASFARFVLVAGGTLYALGVATVIVSSVGVSIAKTITQEQQKDKAKSCTSCKGAKKVKCEVCLGGRIIKHRPVRDVPANSANLWTACAMCDAKGDHNCVHCSGEGVIFS